MKLIPDELEARRIDNLRHAVAALVPEERRLFLSYLQRESSQALSEELGLSLNALRIRVYRVRRKLQQHMAQMVDDAPALQTHPVSPSPVSVQPAQHPTPPLERLRHLVETHFPFLYSEVLEPTLADLREEHSTALVEGHLIRARWILLHGCGALATAAVCQLGYSLLSRIAALWQARSPK